MRWLRSPHSFWQGGISCQHPHRYRRARVEPRLDHAVSAPKHAGSRTECEQGQVRRRTGVDHVPGVRGNTGHRHGGAGGQRPEPLADVGPITPQDGGETPDVGFVPGVAELASFESAKRPACAAGLGEAPAVTGDAHRSGGDVDRRPHRSGRRTATEPLPERCRAEGRRGCSTTAARRTFRPRTRALRTPTPPSRRLAAGRTVRPRRRQRPTPRPYGGCANAATVPSTASSARHAPRRGSIVHTTPQLRRRCWPACGVRVRC